MLSFTANNLQLTTAYAVSEVPIARIGRIYFTNKPSAVAPTSASSIRCRFNEPDAVTLQIDQLVDETSPGTAEGIGALKAPLGAFTRLEINPGAKRTSAAAAAADLSPAP